MDFHPADPISLTIFLTIVTYVIAAVVLGVYVASQNLGVPALRRATLVLAGLTLWLIAAGVVVGSGTIAEAPMPRLMLFMVVSNLAAIGFGLAPVGGWLAAGLPLWAPVAFQIFRLPLELVLHHWAGSGSIPETMTWSGCNFDIVSGVLALAVAMLGRNSRAAAWAFNIVGFGLLVNVMRVAVMSSPLPFAWGTTPPLLLAFHLPYALIVPFCVGGAMFGHVVLTRALLSWRELVVLSIGST